jgi:predicted AAA+ superfamily ATPase
MITKRYLSDFIASDLDKKITLLSGPRQSGKTTLSKALPFTAIEYLNFDEVGQRRQVISKNWSRKADLLVFDELHKMTKWKSWIKGIYDTEGVRPRILVTGSARLDIFRKGSDSLAGRHFLYRIHPFSVAELREIDRPEDALEGIMSRGGFPEPYLSRSEIDSKRWRNSHLDVILRQDLLDLEQVKNIVGVETLIELLASRVGSTISFRNLAQDLQVTPQTVQRWVLLLERLFVIFLVRPYSKDLARSLLKEPKIYFYDTGRVNEAGGARLENVVACALLKRANFLTDTQGSKCELYYLRDREKREVDFLTTKDNKPEFMVEVKTSDDQFSPSLRYFSERLVHKAAIQLVHKLEISSSNRFGSVQNAASWLATLEA